VLYAIHIVRSPSSLEDVLTCQPRLSTWSARAGGGGRGEAAETSGEATHDPLIPEGFEGARARGG
jgi:hypothetical protein